MLVIWFDRHHHYTSIRRFGVKHTKHAKLSCHHYTGISYFGIKYVKFNSKRKRLVPEVSLHKMWTGS